MKLVIHDAAWPLCVPLLREFLKTDWEIAASAGDPAWLAREIVDADALIALRLPPEARGAARKLKALLFPGAGVMHEDPADLPSGCKLCNVYEHEGPIAEYVLMAILMHVTRIRRFEASFREGRWDGNGRVGGEPHGEAFGKTLGLVGYGHIGQAVAARARAFGMRIQAIRRRPAGHPGARPLPVGLEPDWAGGPGDLRVLLGSSDFVAIACPLTRATQGMIGAAEIAHMRPEAMLINVARAEIVDEAALYEALRDGRIAAAALDVWYQYPASSDQVSRGSRFPFHELDNVLLTPHFSAWTGAMLRRRFERIAGNLDRLAGGRELERVVLTGTWLC